MDEEDPFHFLLSLPSTKHVWCSAHNTAALKKALLLLASKTVHSADLEKRMTEELSTCRHCVERLLDIDGDGLDDDEVALVRQYLDERNSERIKKSLTPAKGSEKLVNLESSLAFVEILKCSWMLRDAALFASVEHYVINFLDLRSEPFSAKKDLLDGVFVLAASSIERVRRWARDYVMQCENQGVIDNPHGLELLDAGLYVLLDAVRCQRVVDGRHAILGSSQSGLVVFETEYFYGALWFLLGKLTSEMRKLMVTKHTSTFASVLWVVFMRVDSSTQSDEKSLQILRYWLQACTSNVWSCEEIRDVLEFGDALDMLFSKVCESYETISAAGMGHLTHCLGFICHCAPPHLRTDVQDRVIQFLLFGEIVNIADGAYIQEAQLALLQIFSKCRAFPPVKTEKLWSHKLLEMAVTNDKNSCMALKYMLHQMQPEDSPNQTPVFCWLWHTVLSSTLVLPGIIHEQLWKSHSLMMIGGSYRVDAIREDVAGYLDRLCSDVRPQPWFVNAMLFLCPMLTSCHTSLSRSASKFFVTRVSNDATLLASAIDGISNWIEQHPPEDSDVVVWLKVLKTAYDAAERMNLGPRTTLSDNVAGWLSSLPGDFRPSKLSVEHISNLLLPLRRSCTKSTWVNLRRISFWLKNADKTPEAAKRITNAFPPDESRIDTTKKVSVAASAGSSRFTLPPRPAVGLMVSRVPAPPPPPKRPMDKASLAVAAEATANAASLAQMTAVRSRILPVAAAPPRAPASAPSGPGVGIGKAPLAKKKIMCKIMPAIGEHAPHSPMSARAREAVNEAELKKKRLLPSVQAMYIRILNWKLDDVAAESPDPNLVSTAVPRAFESVQQYVSVFEPLLLLELKAALSSDLNDQKTDEKPFEMESSLPTRVDNYWTICLCFATDPGVGKKWMLRRAWNEDDVLEMKAVGSSGPSLIGIVKKLEWLEKQQRELATVQLMLGGNNASLGNKWTCRSVSSLLTSVREYRALASLDVLPCRDFVLRGDEKKLAAVNFLPSAIPSRVALQKQFNLSQAKAIEQCFRQRFALIQGPPGTGKTKTIVGIIGSVLMTPNRDRRKRVLVCAASNRAVDEVAVRIKGGLWDPFRNAMEEVSLVRFVSQDKAIPVLTSFTLEALAKRRREGREAHNDQVISKDEGKIELAKAQLSRLAKELTKANDEQAALLFAESEGSNEKTKVALLAVNARIKELTQQQRAARQTLHHANDSKKMAHQNKTKDVQSSKDEVLVGADVICCTLLMAGAQNLVKLDLEFDAIIVDEATQATELQTLIPLKYRSKLYVLVGDPKQLPAMVRSKVAKENLYSQSLFQRLLNLGVPMSVLMVQYRMHPKICAFPNAMFYDNMLENGPNVQTDKYNKAFHRSKPFQPFVFCNSTQAEDRNPRSTSSMNRGEAQIACDIVVEFFRRFGDDAVPGGLAVITPYRGQVQLLESMLRSKLSSVQSKLVDINTIDECQGCEKDVVIFSCVRSHFGSSIGFMQDVRRLNVGLTRARFCLIMIGNEGLLRQHEVFNELINHAKIQDAFLTEAEVREALKGGPGSKVKRTSSTVPVVPPPQASTRPAVSATKNATSMFIQPKQDAINQELSNFSRKRDRDDILPVRRSAVLPLDLAKRRKDPEEGDEKRIKGKAAAAAPAVGATAARPKDPVKQPAFENPLRKEVVAKMGSAAAPKSKEEIMGRKVRTLKEDGEVAARAAPLRGGEDGRKEAAAKMETTDEKQKKESARVEEGVARPPPPSPKTVFEDKAREEISKRPRTTMEELAEPHVDVLADKSTDPRQKKRDAKTEAPEVPSDSKIARKDVVGSSVEAVRTGILDIPTGLVLMSGQVPWGDPPGMQQAANRQHSSTPCLFHRAGYCRYGDKCTFVHSRSLPDTSLLPTPSVQQQRVFVPHPLVQLPPMIFQPHPVLPSVQVNPPHLPPVESNLDVSGEKAMKEKLRGSSEKLRVSSTSSPEQRRKHLLLDDEEAVEVPDPRFQHGFGPREGVPVLLLPVLFGRILERKDEES